MSSALQHEALVIECLPGGEVLVRMEPSQSESCSGCALADSCGPRRHKSGESIELRATREYSSTDAELKPGERVLVSPSAGSTSRAATLLLTLPLGGLVGCAVIASALGASEGFSALWGFAGAAAGFVPALLCRGDRGKLRWRIVGRLGQTND
ncbi:MAG: SoxR reducing system RseC family protein [Muribaculaceae bacterium]|nr:SoxR reducing system RseC family protein [Muribaculaceae bacterium]